jgi:hypothetical protein
MSRLSKIDRIGSEALIRISLRRVGRGRASRGGASQTELHSKYTLYFNEALVRGRSPTSDTV